MKQPARLFIAPCCLRIGKFSVNTEEADLKLFFGELERIGKGEISTQAFTTAKPALKTELEPQNQSGCMKRKTFALDQAIFNSLTIKDVYQ